MGHYGHCLAQLEKAGYLQGIKRHIASNKPFLGICVGLQAFFQGSSEDSSVPGLGVLPGNLQKFDDCTKSVPHIGWNLVKTAHDTPREGGKSNVVPDARYYFVHSYAAPYQPGVLESQGWTSSICVYGEEKFVAAFSKGNILATQFHPEKSGSAGLTLIKNFLNRNMNVNIPIETMFLLPGLTRRLIACLDVRANDDGDLVVTKGDKYEVRDKSLASNGQVRNLGKPVGLAQRYYHQGADEITFLNITSFRSCPLADLPMMEVLRQTSKSVFVPLTVGGGIQDSIDADGTLVSALEVATLYFKSGADKVSIGSDAVLAAEEYIQRGHELSGRSAIETISAAYGRQAVVVSVDPKRVPVQSPEATRHHTIPTNSLGPHGEPFCWYQCTIKGGREGRDIDVRELVTAVEAMGAGEILLNCIDRDGSKEGFDLELVRDVKDAVKIPVIASSGAGCPDHFRDVFTATDADAALGAGIVSQVALGSGGKLTLAYCTTVPSWRIQH